MKWSEETPNKSCKNHTIDWKIYGQLACQKLCTANSGCVGINWKRNQDSLCGVCQDDVLYNPDNDYGFYRKPTGNNEVYYIT